MNSFKKILCVVDPTTRDQPAVHRAAWIAKHAQAELELLICFYNEFLSGQRFFDAPSLTDARDESIKRNKEYLEDLAKQIRSTGTTVRTSVIWDRPLYDGIVRHAIACNANLVLKDTHHHSTLERALLTNTDWNLLRTCPTPLWLVKARDIQTKPIILASIDPTHRNDKPASLDDRILNLSRMLADVAGAELHVFHSYDPRVAFATATANAYIPVSMPIGEIESDMREQHRRRFDEVVASQDLSDDQKHLLSGATHEELPELAKDLQADLVVMGAIARNLWKRLYLGATAERTLEHLPCDLLIVKPDWFETPVSTLAEEAVAYGSLEPANSLRSVEPKSCAHQRTERRRR